MIPSLISSEEPMGKRRGGRRPSFFLIKVDVEVPCAPLRILGEGSGKSLGERNGWAVKELRSGT